MRTFSMNELISVLPLCREILETLAKKYVCQNFLWCLLKLFNLETCPMYFTGFTWEAGCERRQRGDGERCKHTVTKIPSMLSLPPFLLSDTHTPEHVQGVAGLPGPIGIGGLPGLPGQKGEKVKVVRIWESVLISLKGLPKMHFSVLKSFEPNEICFAGGERHWHSR